MRQKIYLITNKKSKDRTELLESAASGFNLLPKIINTDNLVDFSQHFNNISPRDIVYRLANNDIARLIENQFLSMGLTSIYLELLLGIRPKMDEFIETILYYQHNIPIPQSFINPGNNRELIRKIVNKIGLPVIVKVPGGQNGTGVMKAESLESLLSIIDFLHSKDIPFILKEFIQLPKPVNSHRAIVLGNNTIFCYKNESVELDDFRSNTDHEKRNRKQIELVPAEKEILANTVASLGLGTGAVDFARVREGNIKIFEVNSPFNFIPLVRQLSFNYHEKLVEYLVNKEQLI